MSEENQEKRKVAQPFSIKLYPDEIDRFKQIKSEMDNVTTDRGAFIALMEYFENPKTVEVVKDSQATLDKLAELQANAQTQAATIADLQRQLEEAKVASNTNAETGTQLQLRIEQLEAENKSLRDAAKRSPYYIGGELPPVPFYYATKMAELQRQKDKQYRSPFYILANNFIQDLQNPRSNHLPMIVTSDELRKAQEDYEKSLKKNEETKEE